mmetsp:Transcript_21310/g.32988  ORF Transcript_21310/g.32988 Transcript_21310/m.32988 type:complete len:207 (+) Transcript_21310:710-1330(+)
MVDGGSQEEPPLIKAIRKENFAIAETILDLDIHRFLNYFDVLCLTDKVGRNALHLAVIKSQNKLVQRLVFLDADSKKMRGAKDSKGKTPEQYDFSSQFKDVLVTLWDIVKTGNVERLKQIMMKGGKTAPPPGKYFPDTLTPWLKNSPLHAAVKAKQLEVVRFLVFDLDASVELPNKKDFTPMAYCNKYIKDEATYLTMKGLLEKTS